MDSPVIRTSTFRQIARFWKTWIVLLVPIVLIPLPIAMPSQAGRCAYALLIMAIYWMTEALPMAVTALLPLILMPWLGVAAAEPLAKNYLKDTNMLFFGGLIVAVAVEHWNLHKRIALRVLLIVGSQPTWLMFGFMVPTAFLSMWISNTATCAMMVPIVQAVLSELEDKPITKVASNTVSPYEEHDMTSVDQENKMISPNSENIQNNSENGQNRTSSRDNSAVIIEAAPHNVANDPEMMKARVKFDKMAKGLLLSIAYSANIGGTATLTGTGPNLVLKGQLDLIYGSQNGINFSSWILLALPNAIIALFLAWILLQIMFLGPSEIIRCLRRKKDGSTDAAGVIIRREYAKLGPMSFAEIAVLVHFTVMALLWITREPEFVPGWASLFTRGYITDACVALTISVSLFIFPSKRPNFLCFRPKNADPSTEMAPVPALLDWFTLQKNMGWSVIFVLGGGFALAEACQTSGLSQQLGNMLGAFRGFPVWAMAFLLALITAVFTEITSNVATATIFLPILAELAYTVGVNPLYLMIPVTIACSFAFMLPVATPPNAIVFTYGRLEIFDMVKTGVFMNIICLLVLAFSINTYAYAYLGLGTIPEWALKGRNVNLTSESPNFF